MARPFDIAELEALREFFAAWEAFHGMKNALRKDKEEAAQSMVDKAKAVQRMQRPDLVVPRILHA